MWEFGEQINFSCAVLLLCWRDDRHLILISNIDDRIQSGSQVVAVSLILVPMALLAAPVWELRPCLYKKQTKHAEMVYFCLKSCSPWRSFCQTPSSAFSGSPGLKSKPAWSNRSSSELIWQMRALKAARSVLLTAHWSACVEEVSSVLVSWRSACLTHLQVQECFANRDGW